MGPAGDAPSTTARSPRPARAGKAKHVLVVDDNHFNQEVASELLIADGHVVSVAPDGAKALQAIAEAIATGRRFDACLMDVNMPVMDGLQATRMLREMESSNGGHRLLVIALSELSPP